MTTESIQAAQSPQLLQRPECLPGYTYRIKPPLAEHAYFITINHIEVAKTGKKQLFEIFVNTKNMENYDWIVAWSLTASAIFRQVENPAFLVEQLAAVHSPKGGYIKPGSQGRWVGSLVVEIGDCIEKEMLRLGIKQPEEKEEKRA
ncbi:MAG: hypothetical protein HQL72_02185 [Magnetococcales bacterium]|nr:hypothetical protein [Magnetococcales bacterium]